jgi:hypothetical protein
MLWLTVWRLFGTNHPRLFQIKGATCFLPPQTIPDMTDWRFDLRSGYDSDDDDPPANERMSSSGTHSAAVTSDPADSHNNSSIEPPLPCATDGKDATSKELEDLFGATEDEAVHYKPNPWNIAKINANARASSARLANTHKQVPKVQKTKPTGDGKRLFPPAGNSRFQPFASKALPSSKVSSRSRNIVCPTN